MTVFARKKPVTIECMQYNGLNKDQVLIFCGHDNIADVTSPITLENHIGIKTLEGIMKISDGDIVIKGINGEFYPCKYDIFKATYDIVDDPADDPKFCHTFSWALDQLKLGKRIHRKGWNGKGMSVVLMKGYPEGVACNKQTAEAWNLKEGDLFRLEPYMQIQMVNGSHSMWVPSVNDCLAEDWATV